MKKLYSILITLVLLITCFSCSSNEEASFNTQTKEEDQTTIVEENKQEEDDVVKQDTSNEEVTSTIVDKQEEVKEEIKVLDNGANPNYNYWVTFYDHDGNILQQDAIKYGTVPTYWSDTPYYDDGTNWYKGVGWTDAYGRDVTEFQPIKGNTRFYAKYEVGGAVSHSSSHSESSNPAPTPFCSLSTQYLLHINSISGSDVFSDVYIWDSAQSKYLLRVANTNKKFSDSLFSPMISPGQEWIHTGDISSITYDNCSFISSHLVEPYSLCSSTQSIIKINRYRSGWGYQFDWYDYDSGTGKYQLTHHETSYWGLPTSLQQGHYYHVGVSWGSFTYVASSTAYTECLEAELDHLFTT